MGIRFSCHHCTKRLHIKSELAGRRAICPKCGGRFRIPLHDAEFSTAADDSSSSATLNSAAAKAVASESSPGRKASGRPVANSSIPAAGKKSDSYLVRPPSGGTYGPVDVQTLKTWISQNRITPDTEVALEGGKNWQPAADVFPNAFQ